MAKSKPTTKEYYLKFTKGKRTYFVDGKTYDKTGMFKFVSRDKVEKSKKPVSDYSVKEHRVRTPEAISVAPVKSQQSFVEKQIINSDILSQSIKKAVMIGKDQGKKIAIKFKGKIHEIKTKTVEQLKSFLDFTDKINSAYFDAFKGITNSPLFFVGYHEGKKGIVFDYSNIMIGSDDELADEFPDEVKKFRSSISSQFKKFI